MRVSSLKSVSVDLMAQPRFEIVEVLCGYVDRKVALNSLQSVMQIMNGIDAKYLLSRHCLLNYVLKTESRITKLK